MSERGDKIMAGMGFPPHLDGTFVTDLRQRIERQVQEGMVRRSGGTWAEGSENLTLEERARALLAFDWEIEQGHSYRAESLDSAWGWTFNASTGKRAFRIRWARVPAKVRDRGRRWANQALVFWHRKVLRRRNPYAPAATASHAALSVPQDEHQTPTNTHKLRSRRDRS